MMHQVAFKVRLVWPLLVVAGLSGCSQDDRPRGVPVSGVVLYKGQPVEGSDVAFSSTTNERGAFGRTDAQGQFQLMALETKDGIAPDTYRVKITKDSVESEWHPDWDEGVRPKEVQQAGLPARYGNYETSGLTATVTEDGPNEFRFELTD